MAFFGSHYWKDDDDDMSLNDHRVRRYQEEKPVFPPEQGLDMNKIRAIVEFFVIARYDRANKTTINKIVNDEIKELKKRNLI